MTLRRIPRLILVTNRKTATLGLPELAERAIQGGVEAVQIRENDLQPNALIELCQEILAEVRDHSKLMVNSSAVVARSLGIGLHLPESAQTEAESHREHTLLGRSVHSPESAASVGLADFVIAGHVFPTKSKPGLPPLGLDGLTEIVESSSVPVLGIGGITPERVASVLATGATGVAVMSAINDARDPRAAARQFKQALEAEVSETVNHIDVTINGKNASVPESITVLEFLKQRGHHERLVVVELNGEILRKGAFPTTTISAGDRIEIVHFVGGG